MARHCKKDWRLKFGIIFFSIHDAFADITYNISAPNEDIAKLIISDSESPIYTIFY